MNRAFSPHFHRNGSYKSVVYFICLIGSLGGLLFGLDQGFIANALDTIQSIYHLDTTDSEKYSALLATGGVLGALLSGLLGRFLGRKKSLVLTGLLFTLASFSSASLPSFYILYICRFVIGFAIGVASFITPLYLAEIAPTPIRGSMGTLFQLMITIGIFMISATNVYIASVFLQSRLSLTLMFLVIALFALLMLFGSLFLPESPRWLMLKGRKDEAEKVIRKMMGSQQEVDFEIGEIQKTLQTSKRNFFHLITQKSYFKILLIGVLLQMFQQLVGINVMIYYAPTIFGYVGMKGSLIKMAIPTVNMLFTFPAIYLVDKWGRKKLLYIGAFIMLISMLAVGITFDLIGADLSQISDGLKTMLLSACVIYIFGFAFSWGPVAWLICSEIFPLRGRESGMTLTTMVNWTFAGIVMRYSLSFMETFGNSSLFYLLCAFCLISILFVALCVPETKGISLEELEEKLKRSNDLSHPF